MRIKDKPFLIKFGANIRAIRKARGFTQEKLANEIGTSQSYIGKIENAVANSSISHASVIARALEVPVHTLFLFDAPITITVPIATPASV